MPRVWLPADFLADVPDRVYLAPALQAMDGQEALQVVSEEDQLPDVILLDVMMPGMSGYEVGSNWNAREVGERGARTSQQCRCWARGKAELSILSRTGLQVCRRLRELYPLSCIPVIMISAKSKEEHIVEGLAAGSNDYVVKPFGRQVRQAEQEARLRLFRRAVLGFCFVRATYGPVP